MAVPNRQAVVDAYVASRTLTLGLGQRAAVTRELDAFLLEEQITLTRELASMLSYRNQAAAARILWAAAAKMADEVPVAVRSLPTVA